MNITISRMEMLDTARRMASIAPADSPLEVLRGVLLEADADSRETRIDGHQRRTFLNGKAILHGGGERHVCNRRTAAD